MSKHKHFYNIKNPAQLFQHVRREKIGLLDPGRALPRKKTARCANTERPEVDTQVSQTNESVHIVTGAGKGSQDERR